MLVEVYSVSFTMLGQEMTRNHSRMKIHPRSKGKEVRNLETRKHISENILFPRDVLGLEMNVKIPAC